MEIAVGAIVGFGIVFSAVVIVFRMMNSRRHIGALFGLRPLAIHLPQERNEEGEKQDILKEINRSAQLLGVLGNLNIPFVLEAAVANVGEDIVFYLSVPEQAVTFAANQIHGLWPEAHVEPAHEYTVFQANGAAAGANLYLKHSEILPIRTYAEAELDTFAPILSNLSSVGLVGEGIAIQVVVQPAPRAAKDKASKAIYELKKGKRLSEVMHNSLIKTAREALKTNEYETRAENRAPLVIDDEAIKAVSQKIAKPLFEVNVRLISGAVSPFQADALLNNLAGSFGQFSAPMRNEFRAVKPRNLKKFMFRYAMREFDPSAAMLLNSEEIASIFHLPAKTTNVPKVKWLKAKEAPPPTALPSTGVLVGESPFRGEVKPIFLTDEDRRRHVYVIGQTGTGKSTLLTNMAIDDIRKGKGIAVIDPHGDLVETIVEMIPRERVEDLIVFDPGARERPIGMNMLEFDPEKPEEKTFIVNELFSILDKLYDMKTVGGPMFEQYTKNAVLLLMEDMVNEPATLMEIPRVFTDPEFRNRKLARITNPVVIDFWQKEATKATGEHSLGNMAPYITSKFNNFIANDYVRPIIGQPHSAFNFREVMDSGKILLVNLSKGKIGDINANLLGMVIVGKILMAALSRVDTTIESRHDFNLYIDEFQNFTTDSIATILSEARKYRLNLTVAHQFTAQLTEKVRDAVFGNVGSIIAFRVGVDDIEVLGKQFEPVFSKNDLLNIDNFNAHARLLINGSVTKPFNIRMKKGERGNADFGSKAKALAHLKYGADRHTVEQDILARLRA
ncbi:MAG: DUF87 domain-containing protein [Patescibacteria group bacterium]